MVAHICKLELGTFIHSFGDAHIYSNHIEQCKIMLDRESLELPTVRIKGNHENIFEIKYEDIIVENYLSHPALKGIVAI